MKRQLFISFVLTAVQTLQSAGGFVTGSRSHHLTNVSSTGSGDIIGGTLATQGQFPWQVAITSSNNGLPEGFCGGTLVSTTAVLTSAHCVQYYSQFEVTLGTLRALDPDSANRVTVRTLQKEVHEAFDADYGLNNDIALLILPEPLEFSATIEPLLLPRMSDASDSYVARIATVSGWGKIADGPGFTNDDLLYVYVEVVPNAECMAAYGPLFVPPTKMCMSTAGGTKGPCSGDSGGPMVLHNGVENVLIGITSFGSTSGCTSGYPDVFTRVSSFLEWVEEHGGPPVRP